MEIVIKGITHKFKNRIREHGDVWIVTNNKGKQLNITPKSQVNSPYPYGAWVTEGIEIEIIERVKK